MSAANELKCNIRMSGTAERTTIFKNHKVLNEWTRDLCTGMNMTPPQNSKEPAIVSCGFKYKGIFYKADTQSFWKADGTVSLNLYYRKGTSALIIYDDPRPEDLQSTTIVTPGQVVNISKDIVKDNIYDRPSKRKVILIKKISVDCEKS